MKKVVSNFANESYHHISGQNHEKSTNFLTIDSLRSVLKWLSPFHASSVPPHVTITIPFLWFVDWVRCPRVYELIFIQPGSIRAHIKWFTAGCPKQLSLGPWFVQVTRGAVPRMGSLTASHIKASVGAGSVIRCGDLPQPLTRSLKP